jgi:hypothetical protein
MCLLILLYPSTLSSSFRYLFLNHLGDDTNCAASHFKNMRLVFNLAFCGSVAGNRYNKDCPIQAKSFETCNEWIESNPPEMSEAYWKIRGVYVYQREWERAWV